MSMKYWQILHLEAFKIAADLKKKKTGDSDTRETEKKQKLWQFFMVSVILMGKNGHTMSFEP